MSNLDERLLGELTLGFDFKQQRARVLFGRQAISATAFDVGQLLGTYAWRGFDSRGESAFEATLHVSPGGIGHYASGAAYSAASQGRFTRTRFVYLSGETSRTMAVGPVRLAQTLDWQYAAVALPQTEQLALGGRNAVRGYTLDDGAYDRGLTLHTDLRPADPLWRDGAGQSSLAPFLYLDAGYAGRVHGPASRAIAALGGGIDLRLMRRLLIAVDAGLPLISQGSTRAYHPRVNLKVTVGL